MSKFPVSTRASVGANTQAMLILAFSVVLSGCLQKKPVEEPVPPPVVIEKEPELSTAAIVDASKQQIIFAQTALTKLGFKLGTVDGFWGPRSAKALQQFELSNSLISAGGFLSEANLSKLTELSGLAPEDVMAAWNRPKPVKKVGIKEKLTPDLNAGRPQLVIVEKNHTIYSQPNPFSEIVLQLQSGTGIYVINETEGWLTVETVARQKGYIQVSP